MEALIHGITTITLGQIAMMLIGALLMYLPFHLFSCRMDFGRDPAG